MSRTKYELLRSRIRDADIDSFLIDKQVNVRYITGFTGDYCYAAVGLRKPVLFTSSLYLEEARSSISSLFKIIDLGDDVIASLTGLGVSFWGKKTGYEAESVTCSTFERLKGAFEGSEFVPTKGMVETLRAVKTPTEIDSISGAQEIAEGVFDEILPFLKEGVEERDIACEIDYRFRKHGGEGSSFDTIVAFGENSSKPHAQPSVRKLKRGDIILFDMGTILDGYASDMTRTLVFGKAGSRLRKAYSLVLDAQESAIEGIASGVQCAEVDNLASNVIDRAGFGEAFMHSLGHGVGLEVHEMPKLSKRSEAVLKKGMVITVEPGVYFPGWGGVRIEDMVEVTEDGCRNLTGTPKELIEL